MILLRRLAVGAGFEVFLVRRHRGSSFMASAFVFPGGAAEEGEDARTAAARELFEEAGVLFAKASDNQDSETLTYFAHWITPSVEPKRFSARYYVAVLPAGQAPSFDAQETVDEAWVTPEDALARAGELQLPPPQIRTFWELAQHKSISQVMAAAKARSAQPHPIMPRLMPGTAPALLLPWDPEYLTKGTGESTPLTYQPSWATGPSRFILDGKSWKHVAAPGSTSAGS